MGKGVCGEENVIAILHPTVMFSQTHSCRQRSERLVSSFPAGDIIHIKVESKWSHFGEVLTTKMTKLSPETTRDNLMPEWLLIQKQKSIHKRPKSLFL